MFCCTNLALWQRLLRYAENCLTESRRERGSCGVCQLMGHGEGTKQGSQKEFLLLLVQYLYQHVCRRQE